MKATLLLMSHALAFAAFYEFAAAAPAAKPKSAPAAMPADAGWPSEHTKDGVKLRIYQPQLEEWKDYRELKARAAFVLTAMDGKPAPGVVEISGATTTDTSSRTVFIRKSKLSARFPSLSDLEVGPMRYLLQATWPASLPVSLDRLSAGIERKKVTAKPHDLKMEPPKIFVSARPAILLIVEGEPVKVPVPGTNLEFVVNTNWDLFFDPASEAYFLLTAGTWLTAPQPDGEWVPTSSLPQEFSKLPRVVQWDHVIRAMPSKVQREVTVPRVFYAAEPAELIVFDGNPLWEEVADTRLLWGKNTASWVFENTEDRQIYYLVSGRWFRSLKWEGPWTFASGELPGDFKSIPPDSGCADVLASVPGTPWTDDAVLLAHVPQEALVKRREVEAKVKVSYDGEPIFEPVKDTAMTFAVNTGSDVICLENKYYLCQDAVWFEAAAARGPWTVCADVPAVIFTIPPASPMHRVTYVKTGAGESDDVAVCYYTAGYFGAFVAEVSTGATLVWGSGYYYPPYVGRGGTVPVLRPWPATYGAAAAYNPRTGGYALGARAYGPYANAGRSAWYNPATGTYGRATRIAGSFGARSAAVGYNPRTASAWATYLGNNAFARWGTSAMRPDNDWVLAENVATEDGGVARSRGSQGGGRVSRSDEPASHYGDLYAGHDGNVYRRDADGIWARYDNGDWESVDRKDPGNRTGPDNQGCPGPDGGDTCDPNIPDATTPGAGGSGERRINPGDSSRPGRSGTTPETDPDDFESRAPARRAETQPAADVIDRLIQAAAARDRGNFNFQQRQSFQQQAGRAGGRTLDSRSGADGASSGGSHSGGLRRR